MVRSAEGASRRTRAPGRRALPPLLIISAPKKAALLFSAKVSDRARRDERAIKVDVVEDVRREGADPVAVGRRAIAEMRAVRVAVGLVAGDRQEGDALLGNRHPAPLTGQELEAAAALAIGGGGAVVAAAAELAVLSMHAGVDVVGAGRRVRRRGKGEAKRRPQESIHHKSTAPVGGR